MLYALVVASSLHVLTSVFWAGSTITLARAGVTGEKLFAPQMAAAVIVIVTGGYLYKSLHEGASGPVEHVLAVGVLSALAAFAIQVLGVGLSMRQLRDSSREAGSRSRIVLANRIAAVLLAVAALAMGGSRYV
jgi:uncharacterized membrane protein